MVELRVNVTQAYTGTLGTLTLHAGGGASDSTEILNSNVLGTFAPLINVKITGERIVTAVSASGAQGPGDTIAASPGWIVEAANFVLSADITGEARACGRSSRSRC